ncbi:MAG: hypothetical protein PHQ43_00565 [Dehalococcoidales bacterium]|nr:hypothetical protein [Dehalococcoidales bacterium]
MAVRVVDNETGKSTLGMYAVMKKGGQVWLYTGIKEDPEGGWHGAGLRLVLAADKVTVSADDPVKELKQES